MIRFHASHMWYGMKRLAHFGAWNSEFRSKFGRMKLWQSDLLTIGPARAPNDLWWHTKIHHGHVKVQYVVSMENAKIETSMCQERRWSNQAHGCNFLCSLIFARYFHSKFPHTTATWDCLHLQAGLTGLAMLIDWLQGIALWSVHAKYRGASNFALKDLDEVSTMLMSRSRVAKSLSLYHICWTGEVALTGTFKQQWSSRTDFESQEVDASCSRSFLHKAYVAACYSTGRVFGLLIPLAATLNPCYLLMWNAFHIFHRRKSDQHTTWSTTHVFCMFGSSWKLWAGQVNLDQHVICLQAVVSHCRIKDIEKMNEHVQWMKIPETDTSSVWKSWTSWKACTACSLLPALSSNTLTLHDFVATLCHFTTLCGVAFNRMPRACTKECWWDLAAVPAIPFKGTIGKDLLGIKFTLAKHGVKQIL